MRKSTIFLSMFLAIVFIISAFNMISLNSFAAGYSVEGIISSYDPGTKTSIYLKQNGNTVYTAEINAESSNGIKQQSFSFTDVEAGTYDLVINKAGSLSYTITGIIVDSDIDLTEHSNPAVSDPMLIAGDISGDDYIDSVDVARLAFDMSKEDADASYAESDLNGDGFRDAIDVSIISFNLLKGPLVVAYSEAEEGEKVSAVFVGGDDAQGNAPDTIDVTPESEIQLPVNTFTNPGYVFTGWNNGKRIYQPGDSYILNTDTTFTAVWGLVSTGNERMWAILDPDTVSSDLQFKYYNFDGTDFFVTSTDATTVEGKRAIAKTITAGRASAHINMNSFKLGLDRVDNIDWYIFLSGCDPTAEDLYLVVNLYIEELDRVASDVSVKIHNNKHSNTSYWEWSIPKSELLSGWNHLRLPLSNDKLTGTVKFTDGGQLYLADLNVILNTNNSEPVVVGIGNVSISDSAVEMFNTYEIEFTATEGIGTAPVMGPVIANAIINLPENPYENEGYVFAGWNDGSGTYPAGYAYTVTRDVTFTATWLEGSSELTPFPAQLYYNALGTDGTSVDITFTPTVVNMSYGDGRDIELNIAIESLATNTDTVFQNFLPTASTYTGDLLSEDGLNINIYSIAATNGTILNMTSHFTWDPDDKILRKTVDYKFTDTNNTVYIDKINLDIFDLATEQTLQKILPDYTNTTIAYNMQSQPVYFEDYFLGIEFPAATTMNYYNKVHMSHSPKFFAEPNTKYSTRTEIIGVSGEYETADAFWNYMYPKTLISKMDDKFYINYNTWWSQNMLPFNEARILEMMDVVYGNMSKYGAYFDDFTLDNGWADMYSVWEIDQNNFPEGFTNILNVSLEYGSGIGIWFSPAGVYQESTNIDWARENGYLIRETSSPKCICGADTRWAADMCTTLSEIVTNFGIGSVKVDGWYTECNDTDHGHVPGQGAGETAAENLIMIYNALRQANPDIVIEVVNNYGISNPSPWWLQYSTVTNAAHGDDSPYGLVPAPVYRESYTTARDYYNLQGAVNFNIPIVSQNTFGVDHQSPEDFTNDMIATFMRGQVYVGQYMKLEYLDDDRWERYANIVNWMRANEKDILSHTEPYLPASWSKTDVYPVSKSGITREVYGYIHDGIMMLRNPWIEQSTVQIKLPVDASDPNTYDLISLYPEVRVYARNVTASDVINVSVNAYETIVLAVENTGVVAGDIYIPADNNTVSSFTPAVDYQVETSAVSYSATGEVTIGSEETQLLVLLEANEPMNISSIQSTMSIKIDGTPTSIEWSGTDWDLGAWDATGEIRTYHWIYAIATIPSGIHSISVDFNTVQGSLSNIACYLWATKDTPSAVTHSNMLPSPEMISVESDILNEYLIAEHEAYILLSCDTLDGVMDGPSLILDTSDKIQGVASIKRVAPDTAAILGKVYSADMDLSAYANDGAIDFWVYISDSSKTNGNVAKFQLASDRGNGNENIEWDVTGLKTGWNHVVLKVSDALRNDVDWTKVNFFRFFQYTTGTATIGIDFVTIAHE